MDTFTNEMYRKDRERLGKAVELYEKLMELEWDTEKLAVVYGWLCPKCNRGLAPHVTVCPCVEKKDEVIGADGRKKWNFYGSYWI